MFVGELPLCFIVLCFTKPEYPKAMFIVVTELKVWAKPCVVYVIKMHVQKHEITNFNCCK